MDHELIAHLNNLSSAEITAEATKQSKDLIASLEDARVYMLLMGQSLHADSISSGIREIHYQRARADDLSALAYLNRSGT